MDITFCGTAFDCTGYGVASRGYALALHRLGHNVKVIPFDAVRGHRHRFSGFDTLLALQHSHVSPDINFVCAHPIWNPGFQRRIISLTFEGPFIPEAWWVPQLNRYNLVVVPCRRNAEILSLSGVTSKVLVQGYGVDPAPALPKPDRSTTPFTFVSVFTWVPRKNIEAMVRAYTNEFSENGQTRLLLKTFLLNATPDEYQLIRDQISAWVGPRRDIIVLDQPYEEIHQLLNQCHAYVCTSVDEGFYLPAAESLMCGLPVITVGYGGQLEFCHPDNSYLVDYDLSGGNAWVKHMDLRAVMRHVFDHYEEATAKAMVGREQILQQCNWDRVTGRILAELP
jgi:glycosyltransferase involved in cell wall biosynthesis